MKRKINIIQIKGLRGLCMALFVIVCLAAGFIAFPAIVAMNLWNYAAKFVSIPVINVYQGLLLWGIIAISIYILNEKQKYFMTFKPPTKLSEAEIEKIMEDVKANAMFLRDVKAPEKDENDKKENV